MIYGIALFLLAAACAAFALAADLLLIRFVLIWAVVAFAAAAMAYFMRRPDWFLKRATGRIDRRVWIVYAPFFILGELLLTAIRLVSRERPYDEIVPGLYLGRRLTQSEGHRLQPAAVVDLTCELSEPSAMCSDTAYLCLQVLDGTAPSLQQLKTGVTWIAEHLPRGSVYVHCAKGHERSATLLIAYLLTAGRVRTPKEGLALLRQSRPKAGLTRSQLRVLEAFAVSLPSQSSIPHPNSKIQKT